MGNQAGARLLRPLRTPMEPALVYSCAALLAAFFPASGFALGSGPWPCARTVATLADLRIPRPPVDDALIARYVRFR